MVRHASLVPLVASALTLPALLCGQAQVTHATSPFIAVREPAVALVHVRVIDGTGSPMKPDQTILIENGLISAFGDAGKTPLPAGVRQLDLAGYTVYPGLVGMHEHLFYPSGGANMPVYHELAFSAPRLYLASGITTMRTAGSLEPYTDINLKHLIEAGALPGPKMDATGPYIEGPGGFSVQMPRITAPEQARRLVDYWVGEGVTSFKAYMNISRDSLAAAIEQAHRHGLKITGHLCSIGFTEAAELGIDDLEHGLVVDTEFTPGKKPGICPAGGQNLEPIEKLDVKGPELARLIQTLVTHHVAITSTLSVFEAFIPGRPPFSDRMLDAMAPAARTSYLLSKERIAGRPVFTMSLAFQKEMQFEREFAARGGLLIAGCDPTGNGGALPGFGDQRNLELLVEAGFKPEEAIRIYTLNGAEYLRQADRIGSIAPGKTADLVVVEGNPAARIADVEKVKYVFKQGIGYDSAKLIDSVRGTVGIE